MTKDEALDKALKALRFARDDGYENEVSQEAITAIKQARALDKMAENARELGLDYETVDGTHVSKVWWDGEKLMAKPIPFVEFYKPVQQKPSCKDCQTESPCRAKGQDLDVCSFYVPPPAAQQEPDAYGYAKRLAVAIWEQHYKDVAPQWKPFDDLMGVLTQIDNMIAGLTVQTQRQPLMDEQINTLRQQYGVTSDGRGIKEFTYVVDFARAIEAAHGIGGKK